MTASPTPLDEQLREAIKACITIKNSKTKGSSYHADIDAILALFTAAQQQLLRELMGKLPKRLSITEAPDEYARQSAMGRNGVITEAEALIQHKFDEISGKGGE